MKTYLFFLLTLIPIFTMAQSRIYKGNSTYSGNILYTYDGEHLYNGNSTYSGNILYTFDGKHLYKGNSTYSGNILYTFDGCIPIAVLVMLI